LFWALKIKSKIFCILPRGLSIRIGKMIGYFLYYFIPLRKRVALMNLKIAFPNKSNSEINYILKKCYIHFGMVISDFLRLPKLNENNISNILRLGPNTQKLLDNNNPAIIMTAHLGNWELFFPILGYNNYKTSGVVQIQKNKNGEKFFNWIRACKNTKMIFKGNAIRNLNKALNEKYYIALASDQNAGEKGTINNLFNMPTSTPKGAAILNIKNNTPIIVSFIVMNKDYTYSISSKELSVNYKNDKTEDKIFNINEAYNKELEKNIVKYPEQYFWFHKKWNKKDYK
tara:strand:+ start:689 stop:1546 length:858 start_codon:yes stop_codon:yes gene_type:complete